MALVTGLPNFYTSAKPAAADFNNAAKALVSQLGGTYWDESAGAYVTAAGALNLTNLATYPVFRAAQTAEPYAFLQMTQVARVAAGAFTDVPMFGPLPCDMDILQVVMVALNGDYYPLGGTAGGYFSVYVNNYLYRNFSFKNVCSLVGDYGAVAVDLQCRVGDVISIDPTPTDSTNFPALKYATAARPQGGAPATTTPVSDLNISLFARAVHVVS